MITAELLLKLQGHLENAVTYGEEADLLARKASRAADKAATETSHVKGILGALARDLETANNNPLDGIEAALDGYVSLIREAEEHAFNARRLDAYESENRADIARNTLFTLINGVTS